MINQSNESVNTFQCVFYCRIHTVLQCKCCECCCADVVPLPPVIDALGISGGARMVAVMEDLVGGLEKVKDVYLTSMFHLPPKLGGVLFGIYSRDDGKKHLEITVISKITKGTTHTNTHPKIILPTFNSQLHTPV